MKKFTLLLCFALPLLCVAQNQLAREYSYDAAGNRTSCAVIYLAPPLPAPPTPPDSTESDALQVTGDALQVTSDELQVTGDELQELSNDYFVELIGQTEIKIYPNPTTEKIMLEFSGGVEMHGRASLRLFTLSGQLLQEQPVYSSTTIVSLAGFANSVYILKVQINGITEDWKVIKQ